MLAKGYLPTANEVWGKVICLQACVCPQGGVPDQVHPPGTRYTPPPWEQTPPSPGSRHPPQTRYTPGSRHPPRVWGKVICLQACVCPQGGVPDQVHSPVTRYTPPPRSRHPLTREQTPPLDQVHPRSRHPPRSLGQGNMFTGVCLSTGGST